jgi:hypothetical protein
MAAVSTIVVLVADRGVAYEPKRSSATIIAASVVARRLCRFIMFVGLSAAGES